MKKQCYRLLNAFLVLMMMFGIFEDAGFIAHAEDLSLSVSDMDGNELLIAGNNPSDPWSKCINFGPVEKPLGAVIPNRVRSERARVTLDSTNIEQVKLKLGNYWTYNENSGLYEDPKSDKNLFEFVDDSGDPAGIGWELDSDNNIVSWKISLSSITSGTFWVIPNIKTINGNNGIPKGRYRQAVNITPVPTSPIQPQDADAYNVSFTFYVDMTVVDDYSEFFFPVNGNRDIVIHSEDCADSLRETLQALDGNTSRVKLNPTADPSLLLYLIDVDGDPNGKYDVTVRIDDSKFEGLDDHCVVISQHQDCTVTKDKYTLIPSDLYEIVGYTYPFNKLSFTFYNMHTHAYHGSTDEEIPGEVEWTWTGDAVNGYYAELKLYCTKSDCPHEDHGRLYITASVKETVLDETCIRGSRKRWTATAIYGDNTYTSVKYGEDMSKPLGHYWKFETDETKVEWTGNDKDGYTAASIAKTCQNEKHNIDVDGRKQVWVKAPVIVEEIDAKCGEYKKQVYTAVFDSKVDPAITEPIVFTKEVKGEMVPHKWKVKYVSSNGDFNIAPTTAQIDLECEDDASHSEIVKVSGMENIIMVSETKESKTYKYVGTASDGQTIEATEEFADHSEHAWTVEFNWNYNKTEREVKGVSAVAICSVGKEQKILKVDLITKEVSNTKQYTATVEDPSGKKWTSTKHIDSKTGELMDGAAGIALDNKSIIICGLEETYPFTNTDIKPSFIVMDGDRVLANGVDYTVSYKNNKKLGAVATITIKGKGNYAGKSATAQFTIVDPKLGVDELPGDKIKKITISEKSFEYNGKPRYPSKVTVELSDSEKTVIEYTIDEDGNYSTTSSKNVVLSFCNNVNKGTATLFVTGSNKSKKKTYKIVATEISKAEFEIGDVTWAVKAETPKITATYNGIELVGGQDFNVKLTAKKAGDTEGSAKISGKGNFKGKNTKTYKVNPLELTEKNIIVNAFEGKTKKVKIQVVDNAGNALSKKLYTYEIQDTNGNVLDKKADLPEEIRVVVKTTAKAAGNVTTGEDGVIVNLNVGKNIKSVKGAFKVNRKYTKSYTGEAIELDEDDFGSGKIELAGLEYGKDFEIVSYKNNVKKGNMTVTVQGIGEYSGIKTFKVKITARPIDKEAPEN